MTIILGFTSCATAQEVDPSARTVKLPGAAKGIDFDDVTYSADIKRAVVPARENGVYLLNPDTGQAKRVQHSGSADSADAGDGMLFVLDRGAHRIDVLNPDNGRVLSSATVDASTDYLRYVPATKELWVSEPTEERIGIFALGKKADEAPRPAGFVPVSNGVEGLSLASNGTTAYTHAGDDVARIDVKARTVTARWPSGCGGTHGFPRVDERGGFLLASCAGNGKAVLLDLKDGHRLGDYELGGDESLPAHSTATGHFYLRSDPGTKIATLAASAQGLKLVRQVTVPENGHCLGADNTGHYWTCDADSGQMLLFNDPDAPLTPPCPLRRRAEPD